MTQLYSLGVSLSVWFDCGEAGIAACWEKLQAHTEALGPTSGGSTLLLNRRSVDTQPFHAKRWA